jgi:hypothetical protein
LSIPEYPFGFPSIKTGCELRFSGSVSSCSISDTRRVTIVTNPMISHEWGKIRILITSLEYSNPCFKTALAIVPPYFKDKYVPIILFPILSVLMTSRLNLLMILVTILKGILKLVVPAPLVTHVVLL